MSSLPPPLPASGEAVPETQQQQTTTSNSSNADLESSPPEKEAPATTTTPSDAVTDWDGPNDPANPKTWSLGSRIFHTSLPALYGFSVSLGTSVYAPGVFAVEAEFGISQTVSLLALSLYALGLGFGPMIGAPISETAGRKAVYVTTLPIFLLFTLGAGFSRNPAALIICRFLAGTFGSPAMAVGAGTVADLWDMEGGGGLATVLITCTFFLGPSLGPLIGGYALETRGDWRWLMWVMMLISGPILIVSLASKETYKKIILARRAKKRGLPGPPKPPPKVALKMLLVVTLLRPLKMLVSEPMVASWALYHAFVFGVLFAFFDSYPYVFIREYGFTFGQIGLAFLGIFIGTVLSVFVFAFIDKTIYQKKKLEAAPGKPAPEERLYVSMFGAFLVPIGLFWFAWTARRDVHWMAPIAAGIPFSMGMNTLMLGGMTYLIDTYGAMYAASAIAANSLLRYAFGAAFPLFTVQMYERLGIAWATSLLAFISVALLPIPFVLYKFGPTLRARTSFKV